MILIYGEWSLERNLELGASSLFIVSCLPKLGNHGKMAGESVFLLHGFRLRWVQTKKSRCHCHSVGTIPEIFGLDLRPCWASWRGWSVTTSNMFAKCSAGGQLVNWQSSISARDSPDFRRKFQLSLDHMLDHDSEMFKDLRAVHARTTDGTDFFPHGIVLLIIGIQKWNRRPGKTSPKLKPTTGCNFGRVDFC